MRLRYNLSISPETVSGTTNSNLGTPAAVALNFLEGVEGSATVRLDAGTPQPLSGNSVSFSSVSEGNHSIFYSDDNFTDEKLLDFNMNGAASGCIVNDHPFNGTDSTPFTLFMLITPTYVEFSSSNFGTNVVYGYSLDDISYTDTNFFLVNNPGSLITSVYRRNDRNPGCSFNWINNIAILEIPENLEAQLSVTDVSFSGGNDGQIEVVVTNGSGNYSYSWADGPTSAVRTNLVAGTYEVTIDDINTGQQLVLTAVVNEPQVIQPPQPFLEVPKFQSLQFVVDSIKDDCSQFENLDNTLFCRQTHPFYDRLQYFQKFNQCDTVTVQFRSSYQVVNAELYNHSSNQLITTFLPFKTFEGLNVEKTFNVRFENGGSGQTRMYFSGSNSIPLVLENGDSFEVFNSTFGNDGQYSVADLQTDSVTGQQFVLINVAYSSVNNFENGEARFFQNDIPFDIFELNIDFSSVNEGYYYVKILTEDLATGDQLTATSEPIHIREKHDNCMYFEWANIDNAYDIDYSNNIVHIARLEVVAFERLPMSEDVSLRTTSGRFILLSSKPSRKFRVRFYNMPPYLHEKVFLMLKSDIIRLNGIEITSEEGLQEPQYRPRFGLSNSEAVVEQKVWHGTYNTTDLGGVDIPSQGFIEGNNNSLIKR